MRKCLMIVKVGLMSNYRLTKVVKGAVGPTCSPLVGEPCTSFLFFFFVGIVPPNLICFKGAPPPPKKKMEG